MNTRICTQKRFFAHKTARNKANKPKKTYESKPNKLQKKAIFE